MIFCIELYIQLIQISIKFIKSPFLTFIIKIQQQSSNLNYSKMKTHIFQTPHQISNITNGIISLQQSQNIRLHRLIQQRKRMQYMSNLIIQQKQAMQMLRRENSQLNMKFSDIMIENQVINNKYMVTCQQCQSLSNVVIRQTSLIQNMKQHLFYGNVNISQTKKMMIQQQFQAILSFKRLGRINGQNNNRHNTEDQLNKLIQQNQILNQKYQQLCQNYLQMSKSQKIKQFQLMRLKGNTISNHQGQHNYNTSKCHELCRDSNQFEKQLSLKAKNKKLKQIIKAKDCQIEQFKSKLQQFQKEIIQRNQLILQHRNNQKLQGKLFVHLKQQFKQQGKQISQIAFNKKQSIIEQMAFANNNSKTEVLTYQVERSVKKSARKARQNQSANRTMFGQKNGQANQFGQINSNTAAQEYRKNNQNFKAYDSNSGYRKTVSKNMIE